MKSKDILNCTVFVEAYDSEEVHTATGFLAIYNSQYFLITNKHVIENNDNIRLKLKCMDNSSNKIINGITVSFTQSSSTILSNKYDLGIIPINNVIDYLSKEGNTLYNTYLDFNSINQERNTYDDIEDIVTVGYPCGFIDNINNYPIVNNGITATSLNIDLEGDKHFLINAHVGNGASGSPVFVKKNDDYGFVGIITASLPFPQADDLLERIPDEFQQVYKYCAASNLSLCIKKEMILELLL